MSYENIYVHVFLFKTRIHGVAAKAVSEKEKNNDTKEERLKKEEKQTYDIEMN